MLRAAQANTLSAKCYGTLRIAWVVCVGPYAQLAELVSPVQQALQVNLFIEIRCNRFDDTCENLTSGAINRDVIALANDNIGTEHAEEALFFVDSDSLSTRYAGQTQAASYYSGVTGCT